MDWVRQLFGCCLGCARKLKHGQERAEEEGVSERTRLLNAESSPAPVPVKQLELPPVLFSAEVIDEILRPIKNNVLPLDANVQTVAINRNPIAQGFEQIAGEQDGTQSHLRVHTLQLDESGEPVAGKTGSSDAATVDLTKELSADARDAARAVADDTQKRLDLAKERAGHITSEWPSVDDESQ